MRDGFLLHYGIEKRLGQDARGSAFQMYVNPANGKWVDTRMVDRMREGQDEAYLLSELGIAPLGGPISYSQQHVDGRPVWYDDYGLQQSRQQRKLMADMQAAQAQYRPSPAQQQYQQEWLMSKAPGLDTCSPTATTPQETRQRVFHMDTDDGIASPVGVERSHVHV